MSPDNFRIVGAFVSGCRAILFSKKLFDETASGSWIEIERERLIASLN
jgi:hypothetical protein